MLYIIFLFFAISFAKTPLVISLDPSTTELLHELDLDIQIVGRDEASNYPPKVKSLPVVSRHLKVDKERIVKLKPDWIIAQDLGFQNLEKNYKPWGIEVLILKNQHLEDFVLNIQRLQKTFSSKDSIKDLKEATSLDGLKNLKKTYIMLVEEHTKIAVGKDSFIHQALSRCGLKNQVKQIAYPKLSKEFLKTHPSDYLFILRPQKDTIQHKDEKTYYLNADIFSRLTLRFFDGVKGLCRELAGLKS